MRSEAKGEAGQEKDERAKNNRGMKSGKIARILGEILLWALLALSVNLLVVFVQNYASWSWRVASGQMTFLQAVYVEWVFYFRGHQYGGILLDDFPGLALLVIALVTRKYHRRDWATRAAGEPVGEALSPADGQVWPPPPRDPNEV